MSAAITAWLLLRSQAGKDPAVQAFQKYAYFYVFLICLHLLTHLFGDFAPQLVRKGTLNLPKRQNSLPHRAR